MRCERCGTEIIEGAAFCTGCGAPVPSGPAEPAPVGLTCGKCGAELDLSFAFCTECGAPVGGDAPEKPAERKAAEDVTQVLEGAAPAAAAAAAIPLSADAGRTMDMLYNDQTAELPNLPQPIGGQPVQGGYAPPAQQVPQYAQPVYQTPVVAAAPAKQRSNVPLIVAVAVAAAAVAFLVAFFVVRGGIGGDTTADTSGDTSAATQDSGQSGSNVTIIVPEGSSTSSSSGSTSYSAPSGGYVIPYSSSSYLTSSDLSGLSYWELRIARNEIYARHGRGFKDSELQSYFNSQSWYTYQYSPDSFPDSLLSNVEKKNAEFIKSYEKSHGSPYV